MSTTSKPGSAPQGFLDRSSNFHPYECDGIGVCEHCDRLPGENHDPATCALCDPEYDYAPNPFRKQPA